MASDEGNWRNVRDQPAYKAGIWTMRLVLALGVLGICVRAAGIDVFPDLTWLGYSIVNAAALLAGCVLLNRAGVRLLDTWDPDAIPRRTVYRDVLGFGRR